MARKSRKHLQNAPIEKRLQKQYTAGIYTRTSSEEQQGNSIENQIKIAVGFIQAKSDIKLHETYIDYGFSSFANVRPGFDTMLSDIEAKIINCVVVKDISRFSRDATESGYFLEQKFPLLDIRFIAVTDDFDSLNSDATKLGTILKSLINNEYSMDLSKKTQSAIAARQQNGSYTPARLPYGYMKERTVEGVEWRLDENAALVIKQIFKSALDGLSAYAIAGKLNSEKIPAPNSAFWTSLSVLRILKNASYTGVLITGKTRNNRADKFKTEFVPSEKWIRHNHHHKAIIDETTFYAVQRILSERSSSISKQKKVNDFFHGKLYCGVCGRKMRPKRATNGSVYYLCPRRDEAAASCTNRSRSETKLKRQIFLAILGKVEHWESDLFESHPYFQRLAFEQDVLMQKYEKEFVRQNQLARETYEEMINNRLIYSTDMRELRQYQQRVHSVLEKHIADIIKSKTEYKAYTLACNEKRRLCGWLKECNELTDEMVLEIIKRVEVDLDGVRVCGNTG